MRKAPREKKILVINGHPDPRPERFCAALSDAYHRGATLSGSDVRALAIGGLTAYPYGPTRDVHMASKPADVIAALDLIDWASQLVFVFPLWLNQPPLSLQWFFAHADKSPEHMNRDGHRGSTRMFVTMEMPALVHRSTVGQKIPDDQFGLPGIISRDTTLIGSVNTISADRREQWIQNIFERGASDI